MKQRSTFTSCAIAAAVLTLAILLAAPAPGLGQNPYPLAPSGLGNGSSAMPQVLQNVRYDQRLGDTIPLDTPFKDETGANVTLRQYFGQKPVLLTLVYYRCPMLCDELLHGFTGALETMDFTAGDQFNVVTVSFNPREGPADAMQKKAGIMRDYRRPAAAAGWHFLTGTQSSIDALSRSVGFHYVYDPQTQQYAHATGVVLLTPDGRISQYYFGIEFAPRDMHLGIVQASHQRIGTVVDQILLYCYHYDPRTGKYGAIVFNIMRLLAGVVMVLVFGYIGLMLWCDRRRSHALS
jgi:protein SCO1/2